MKITPTQDFLHGPDRYVEGTEYDVETSLGYYAVGNGWATSPDAAPLDGTAPAESADLEPHDAGGAQAAALEG